MPLGAGGVGVREVDTGGRLRVFAAGFQQAGLQAQDVVSERVVLVLEIFEVILHIRKVPDLLFKLFYVAFFALPEGSL